MAQQKPQSKIEEDFSLEKNFKRENKEMQNHSFAVNDALIQYSHIFWENF